MGYDHQLQCRANQVARLARRDRNCCVVRDLYAVPTPSATKKRWVWPVPMSHDQRSYDISFQVDIRWGCQPRATAEPLAPARLMRCRIRRPHRQAFAQLSPPRSDSTRTDRAGFEPAVPLTRYAGLANRCLQPLGHLSGEVRILPPRRDIVKLRLGRPGRR